VSGVSLAPRVAYPRRMRVVALTLILGLGLAAGAGAQTRKTPARKPTPPKPPAVKTEPAKVECPAALGTGVKTKREFCFALTASTLEEGIRVSVPRHTGTATLRLDLHNRHLYSEQRVKAGRAFAEYTSSVGVFTRDNELLARAVVQSAFRTQADLVDQVPGCDGVDGFKAVAPVGTEPVSVTLPADVTEVFIIGERQVYAHLDGIDTFTSPGFPVAIVSNLTVEYRPAPAPPARRRR
jgi:hypothetical protein